ncbi:MAG: hypothetical protein K1X94_07980 [Sandaracinaceae bacterium]|nr:hypothetical protein [Sandaracinaceae bacterium]
MHVTSRVMAALACGAMCLACETAPARVPAQPPPAPRTIEEWHEPPASLAPTEPEDEAPQALAEVVAPVSPEPARTIAPSGAHDGEYDSDEPLPVRRYVYRVRLAIPSALGDASDLATPGAELYIDTSAHRARARFVGQSWPVDVGSEVRVRGESAGVYVFDGLGGRPLEPGELGVWFEGGERRPGPGLSVRRDPTTPSGEVGAMVCVLLAEWAGDDRESVLRRCDGRAPLGFRVGLWRAERTADLAIEVPRRALRADELEPPAAIPHGSSRAFYEPASLARIESAIPRGEEIEPTDPEAPGEGLVLENESATRVIVTAQGVPVGWIGPHERGHFVGLRPGPIWVGALRPMGSIALRPRLVSVPARTVLRAPRVRPPRE